MSAAALEAGVSKSLVTKWKTNKVDVPSPDVLKKLSAYFGVHVSELLDESVIDEDKEKPTVQDDGLEKNQRILMEFARSLSEDQAALALKVLKLLVEED